MAEDTKLIFRDSAAEVGDAIDRLVEELKPNKTFFLADDHTAPLVAEPVMAASRIGGQSDLIVIPSGDSNKSIESLAAVWAALSDGGATRHTLLINIGGGMVTDLGGFAASTFKRGIRFVNVPTTLLGAVDAALGGKTGINFNGLKNEVGVFGHAEAVIVSAQFFKKLPHVELLSGYAELLKHSLLESAAEVVETIDFDLNFPDYSRLQELLRRSISVKQRIVAADPTEKGLRKALNLGHTAGHAFESLAMERGKPLAHGVAVAWGLIVDLVLSKFQLEFSSDWFHAVARFVTDNYPRPEIECSDYDRIIDIMRHDKKNRSADEINFTLLRRPGEPVIDCHVAPQQITAALDIMRDLLD